MKYVYGPVRSRRLGNSLGISIVPYKVCSFDCVYCQLNNTTEKTLDRKEYVREDLVLAELESFFANKPKDLKIDYISLSGSGEPTLSLHLDDLIKGIRKIADTPIALITNSSMLVDPVVRREVMGVNLVIPSLDAVTQSVFERIDRPVKGLKIIAIIDALISFKREFKGAMWLEIMLVRGINDSTAYFKKMKRVIDVIKPDKVQINLPVRPPAEKWVRPPILSVLNRAKEIFGENCDICEF